jgi:hypothetical protein
MGSLPLRPGRKFPPDVRCDRQAGPNVVKKSGVFPLRGPFGIFFPYRSRHGGADGCPGRFQPIEIVADTWTWPRPGAFLWTLHAGEVGLSCWGSQGARNQVPCKGRDPITLPDPFWHSHCLLDTPAELAPRYAECLGVWRPHKRVAALYRRWLRFALQRRGGRRHR